jgi:hypothetical protein
MKYDLLKEAVNTSWHGSKKDPEWYELYKDKPLKVKTVNHSGIGGQPKGTYSIRSFKKIGKSKAEFTINFDGSPSSATVDLDNPETVLDKKYDRVLKFYFYSGAMPISARQAFNLFQVKNGKKTEE